MKDKKELEIEKICYYCEYAHRDEGEETVVCDYKGKTESESSCGRFRFDLLKYKPTRINKLKNI